LGLSIPTKQAEGINYPPLKLRAQAELIAPLDMQVSSIAASLAKECSIDFAFDVTRDVADPVDIGDGRTRIITRTLHSCE
jgi:hypothetical protein